MNVRSELNEATGLRDSVLGNRMLGSIAEGTRMGVSGSAIVTAQSNPILNVPAVQSRSAFISINEGNT